jgi:hypothetical protein
MRTGFDGYDCAHAGAAAQQKITAAIPQSTRVAIAMVASSRCGFSLHCTGDFHDYPTRATNRATDRRPGVVRGNASLARRSRGDHNRSSDS